MDVSALKQKLKKNKLVKLFRMAVCPIPYPKYYKKCKVDKNVVLYESFYGKGMTCGPKAIFNELINDPQYENLTHVWVVDDMTSDGWAENFEEYRNHPKYQKDGKPRVTFVKIKSRAYYKSLATAGYLINNSTFPPCFTRKPEQVYINTWHGIPLKLMGYDMPNGNIEVANTERNFLQASYLLSPNAHHTNMYTKSYKLDGIFEGKIIETGQARTDTIIHADRDKVIEKLMAAGVAIDKKKKIVMYAPTWKGENFNKAVADADEYVAFYNKVMGSAENIQVLIKPHQAVYNKLRNNPELKGCLVAPHFDTNKVLSAVDVLISDYSSIYFDFLVTDRPIMFYIPDLEEYSRTRGVYEEVSKLPGPATDNIDELCSWLNDVGNAVNPYKQTYAELKSSMCQYDDGQVSKRIVDAIWGGDFSNVHVINTKTEKKKIFISLGRALQNGITHSFLSLLNNLDYDRFDVTAYLYEAVAPDQVVRMNQINPNVRVLVRTSYTFATRWELLKLVIGMAFNVKGVFRKVLPEQYFERQARRMAGDVRFDSVVEFCGYSPIMAMVLPKLRTKKTAIWMHNDLIADANRKVNHKKPLKRKMAMIFNLYDDWDRLVSCSHSVMEVNQKNLSRPGIEDKFSFAKNTINYQRVLDNLEESCEYEGFPMPKDGDTNFVTMGRLSTEKNHGNLVRAFAEYVKEYPNSRVYIIGEGPLRQQVEAEIERLGLAEKVILTGNLANPFTLMSKCQCFILPSIYEGQPMVLLEARIVGLPIVVSDFSSVTDSLMENGQYLIKSTEDSILEGLKAFSEGKVPVCKFNPQEYNKEAVQEFENAVL